LEIEVDFWLWVLSWPVRGKFCGGWVSSKNLGLSKEWLAEIGGGWFLGFLCMIDLIEWEVASYFVWVGIAVRPNGDEIGVDFSGMARRFIGLVFEFWFSVLGLLILMLIEPKFKTLNKNNNKNTMGANKI
jgi:hypothetical protein